MTQSRKSQLFLRKHSLSIEAFTVVILLIALYRWSNPSTHLGSFFGNAIAVWTGVFVTIVITKFLYEMGSPESKQPKEILRSKAVEFLRGHSLTIFLVITGIGWIVAFRGLDPGSQRGQVVGNMGSEGTQL